MSSELLAPLDLAFWHLETTDHPMHLGALAFFDGGPDGCDGVLELLAERAAAIPRLRVRVRDVLLPVGGAAWRVHDSFDVRRHVRRLRVPGGDFTAGAVALAGELMERPLERGLPPWEMYLLTGAADRDGDSEGEGDGGPGPGTRTGPGARPGDEAPVARPFAVLVKLHHALADGMRAVAIGAGIFDEIAGARTARAAGRRRPRAAPPRTRLPGPWDIAGAARGRVAEIGRAFGIGASVVRAGRLDAPGAPALTADPSGTRRLAVTALDLDEVRRVRRAAGGTANDVLLTVVAGALRRWMLERGDRLPDADPRALVPVSRRRPGAPPGGGNEFSAYLLDLPLRDDDPLGRLAAVRRAMDRNKAAGPARGAGAVALLAGQLPPLAHRFGAPLAGGAARVLFDVLVTNVPLPRSALSLGGRPLRALYPMAPLARGQALAVAMSPYGDRVHIGLVADGRALPDVDGLADAARAELAELLRAV
ncbi:wax ester/triacylglycerol synthase family O-acyltransferase [Streptomyces sp. NPDC047928]|uniref:wax ester/triacylglycerol synthase family O-acyltransferase n=1 Tax=unclassified Streptomyces TaxID=2593676 RepID=UPI00371F8687